MRKHIGKLGLLILVAGLLFWPAKHQLLTVAQTTHGVNVTMTAATPGAGQVAATGYILQRATSSTGTYTQIATGSFTSGSASYLDTTGTPGSTYWYEAIGTCSGCINSPASTAVSATFLAQTAGVQVVATPQ
jgi:hypothetical protein